MVEVGISPAGLGVRSNPINGEEMANKSKAFCKLYAKRFFKMYGLVGSIERQI